MKGAIAGVALCLSSAAPAQNRPLDELRFLVGRWANGAGVVADTGGRSTGTSTITSETDGRSLLRRDHTELFDAAGRAVGGFDQIMLIYRDGDAIRADYSDGEHVIHYTRADVVAGRSVAFGTEVAPDRPTFRLAYDLQDPSSLRVTFEVAPPGRATFSPIATGSLRRVAP